MIYSRPTSPWTGIVTKTQRNSDPMTAIVPCSPTLVEVVYLNVLAVKICMDLTSLSFECGKKSVHTHSILSKDVRYVIPGLVLERFFT